MAGERTKGNYVIPEEIDGIPTKDYYLDVLKGGVIVESIDISNESVYLFGRDQSVVDIHVLHPSVSRQHAVIQYTKDDKVLICDLGSTHFTRVNKNKLKPKTYLELNAGDMISFGESTRLYIFGIKASSTGASADDGDDEMNEEENERASKEEAILEAHRKRRNAKQKKQEESFQVTWGQSLDESGMSDEDDEEDEDLPEYLKEDRRRKKEENKKYNIKSSSVDANSVKDDKISKKMYEKITAKRTKIENMQTEVQRIKAKEIATVLSEGQLHAIERNEKRIKELSDEVEELEESIIHRNETNAEREERKLRKKNKVAVDEENDDDFFDRAKTSSKPRRTAKLKLVTGNRSMIKNMSKPQASKRKINQISTEAETAETIEMKLGELQARYAELLDTKAKQDEKSKDVTAIEAGDSLDQFMSANKTQVTVQLMLENERQLKEVKTELDKYEKLHNITRSSLPSLVESAIKPSEVQVIPVDAPPSTTEDAPLLDVSTKPSGKEEELVASVAAATPAVVTEVAQPQPTQDKPATKRASVNLLPPPESVKAGLVIKKKQVQAVKKQKLTSDSAFALLESRAQPRFVAASESNDDEGFFPPENQSGDGLTALNAKFGY